MKTRRWISIGSGAIVALLVMVVHVPALLAFPYHATIGTHHVYSEQPIAAPIERVLAAADARLATSPIATSGMGRSIYLTDGGWRWHLLALTSSGAFAITRPLSEAIVVNSSDVRRDQVSNELSIAGTRSLSGTIAHEMTHGLIRRHFGILADFRYPAWVREGYCDHVAGGGSLSDADASALIRSGRSAPALAYWHGRRRVEQMLAANGGSVDRLFADAG